jgi:phosphatidylinositol kinase/protein kinase (PI-3  family)
MKVGRRKQTVGLDYFVESTNLNLNLNLPSNKIEEWPLSVKSQVDRLIEEAAKVQNLCQSYVGWCPFW